MPGTGANRGRVAFVGKYQIERRFSEASGQATAYLAFDPDSERHVVLKRYHGGPAGRPGEAEEARSLARVDSPYVAPCYGVERVDDAAYLVVKYIPGRNLAEVRRDGPLGIAQVVSILSQLAEGVAAVHAQGLIHRDIKPANVILHDNGTPRLVDFGLATYLGSSRLRELCGSPPYIAPEQARAESDRINCRTDIFGLGGVLYFLLTRHAPFQGRNVGEIVERARRNAFDRAALCAPGIPRRLARVVERAMATEPKDRPDASALARELERFAARPRRLRRAAIALAGLAGLVGLFLFLRPPPSAAPALRIEAMAIQHHRPGQGLLGRIGAESQAGQAEDEVRVSARLNEPAYCYLIALHPNGQTQLYYPEDATRPPPRAAELSYPLQPELVSPLSDGVGLQAYVLVASRRPLPPYAAWRARLGTLPWQSTGAAGVWRYDGRAFDRLNRSSRAEIGESP